MERVKGLEPSIRDAMPVQVIYSVGRHWKTLVTRLDVMIYIMTLMASIHKDPRGKSPYWYCAFYLPDGRRTFRSTKEKKHSAALKICLSWEETARNGRAKTLTEAQVRKVLSDILENATGEKIQFYSTKSWLEEWIQNRKGTASENTMLRYTQVVRDFLTHLGDKATLTLAAVSPTDIRNFRDKLKKAGRTEATVNNIVKKVLNVPFASAMKMGYISVNPVAAVDSFRAKNTAQRQPFTASQVAALLRVAKDSDWEGVILAGYYTGLRLSNLINLEWDDLDIDSQLIRVKTVKTDTPVVIPIHQSLFTWLSQRPTGIGKAPVFPEVYGSRVSGSGGISGQFRKLLKKAKVESKITPKGGKEGRARFALSFHSLRHTFVTGLAQQGIAVDVRKKLAGHASDQVHEIYSHHDVEVMRKAVGSLPPV